MPSQGVVRSAILAICLFVNALKDGKHCWISEMLLKVLKCYLNVLSVIQIFEMVFKAFKYYVKF